MRILVVGAGATGGYYGGRLVEAGRDVTFLVRGQRLQQLRERGLQIASPSGDATVHPQLITADQLAQAAPFDAVFVSTKAYSLEAAMADFAPAVGPETVVLPVLNGMRHVDVLTARFGAHRILPGSVRIVADLDAEGRVVQMTDLDQFTFGELDGSRSKRAEALLQTFSVHGVRAILSEDIVAALWAKWWLLATMGGICVVSGGSVGEVNSVPHGREFALAVMHESMAIAAANGYPATAGLVEAQTHLMTDPGSQLTSSLFRDMTKGYAVEADHILGDLLARAKEVATPLLTGAYVRLKIYEAARAQRTAQ